MYFGNWTVPQEVVTVASTLPPGLAPTWKKAVASPVAPAGMAVPPETLTFVIVPVPDPAPE
jgi:hypothetical protein